MPYPNEHSARIEDPDKYERIRRENDKFADGIHALWGVLEDETVELQAVHFDKIKYSVAEAKDWLKENEIDYISFEPASEEEEESAMSGVVSRRSFGVDELRVTEEKEGEPLISGHAAVFDVLSGDLYGFQEKIKPGAFRKTIKCDDIRALWNHDSGKPLGRNANGTLTLKEDDTGLAVEIKPSNTQWCKDAVIAIERGDVDQMSFGFRTVADKWEEVMGGEIRTLIEVRLYDVSPVTFPAYTSTDVQVRALLDRAGMNPRLLSAIMRAVRGDEPQDGDGEAIEAFVETLRPDAKSEGRAIGNLRKRLDLMGLTF